MAVLAGCRKRLEVKQTIVPGLQGAVASGTDNFFVPAFEGEAAVPIVVEFLGQPIHRHMATIAGHGLAIGSRLVGKLVPMDILVATRAVPGCSAERQFGS